MDFVVIGLVAFLASGLTLYSGFGLGTVLLPAFAIFFPVPVAVAATAAVHLLNNLFKGALLWRQADWRVVLRFGVSAVPAAVAGAWLLGQLGSTLRLFEWTAFGREFGPSGAGVAIGLLLAVFAVLEFVPAFQRLSAPPKLIPVGGLVTGFIGGLTGQQGAFRSMFLLKAGLEPPRFIATGVMIAILVDLARLPTYFTAFYSGDVDLGAHGWLLVGVGAACALAGAYIGVRYATKATLGSVRVLVAVLMLLISGALIAGLIGS